MIGGGEAQGSRRLALFIWHMNVIIFSIRFHGARKRERLAAILISKAARVQSPHIPLGVTIDNPLRHHFTDAACTCNAMRTERARYPETAHSSWTQQIFRVRCKAFRSI